MTLLHFIQARHGDQRLSINFSFNSSINSFQADNADQIRKTWRYPQERAVKKWLVSPFNCDSSDTTCQFSSKLSINTSCHHIYKRIPFSLTSASCCRLLRTALDSLVAIVFPLFVILVIFLVRNIRAGIR